MATVTPTRMELQKTKKRLATAVRGHKLLKDKQDEMARQFMQYIRRNRALRQEIQSLLADAVGEMRLAEAEMGTTALEEALLISAATKAPEFSTQNIMSMKAPKITAPQSSNTVTYGFAFTCEKLDSAYAAVHALMPKLYELAAVEKTCDMLSDEMERTRRRVNALEYVMIPQMEATIKYITAKLDDNERSNIIRLMKVKELMHPQG